MASDDAKIFTLLFGLGRRMRDEKQRHSMVHFQTLRYVKERGRPPIHEVAQFLCVTRPAASLLVDGLVREGLLRRSLDPKDRRTARLALTAQGKAFFARGMRERVKKIGQLFSILSKKERRALIAMLEKISQTERRR